MDPFIAEQIGLEKIQDIMAPGYLLGGRGGKTTTGSKVYSPSDSLSDKFEKSYDEYLEIMKDQAVNMATDYIPDRPGF